MSAAPKKKRTNTRLMCGPFFADVVSDTRSNPPVHHWIVQREGSPDVIQWGQESTFEDAEREASLYLNRIVEREAKSG